MLHPKIKSYLDKIESENIVVQEYIIASDINNILKEDPLYKLSNEDIAEAIAFDLTPEYPEDNITGWGLYYGPKFVLNGVESPGRSFITEDVIDYWRIRSLEVKNLLLKIRYADIVFEFSKVKGFDVETANLVVSSTIKISKSTKIEALNGIIKLKRALNIAKSFKDKLSIKIEQIADATANFEKRTADDLSPGLWGYSFEWFVLETKNQLCSDLLKIDLLNDLIERIKRLSLLEQTNAWAIERGASELLEYYKKTGDSKAIRELLITLEESYKKDTHNNSSGMLIVNYLKKLHDLYFQFKHLIGDGDLRRIECEIQEKSTKVIGDMKEISTTIKITEKQINEFKYAIFGKTGEEKKIDEVVKKIFLNFISRLKQTKKSLDETYEKYPLQFLVSEQLVNHEGVTIAIVGGLENDYQGRLYSHGSKLIQYNSFLLQFAFDEFFKKFKNSEIIREFLKSKIFSKDDKPYLLRLLKHYRARNFLEVSALTIPYIESLIREFAKYAQVSVLKKNKDGGFDYCGLETLFESGFIQGVFGAIGDDVAYHLKLVLTSNLGLNLRNVFCHGINKEAFYSQDNANELLLILITLSLVRIKTF